MKAKKFHRIVVAAIQKLAISQNPDVHDLSDREVINTIRVLATPSTGRSCCGGGCGKAAVATEEVAQESDDRISKVENQVKDMIGRMVLPVGFVLTYDAQSLDFTDDLAEVALTLTRRGHLVSVLSLVVHPNGVIMSISNPSDVSYTNLQSAVKGEIANYLDAKGKADLHFRSYKDSNAWKAA